MAVLLAAALLGGCGGGVSIGIGIGEDDDPPRVVLTTVPVSARVGEQVTLVADARDDFDVRFVDFYEVVSSQGALRLLGRVFGPPFQFPVVPVAAGTLRFEAQAVDDVGQGSDFAVAVLQVLP